MIQITESAVIAAPVANVWPLLSDPNRVASCIPGAQVTGRTDDGGWQGSIEFKFGPTRAVFRGLAKLDYDHAAHRCDIEARGTDQRGASRANATFTITAAPVQASEGRDTELGVAGGFNVNGPLAAFANAGGVHLARAMLAQFAANLAAAAVTAPPAAQSQQKTSPSAPASGFKLIWDAITRWWRTS